MTTEWIIIYIASFMVGSAAISLAIALIRAFVRWMKEND